MQYCHLLAGGGGWEGGGSGRGLCVAPAGMGGWGTVFWEVGGEGGDYCCTASSSEHAQFSCPRVVLLFLFSPPFLFPFFFFLLFFLERGLKWGPVLRVQKSGFRPTARRSTGRGGGGSAAIGGKNKACRFLKKIFFKVSEGEEKFLKSRVCVRVGRNGEGQQREASVR